MVATTLFVASPRQWTGFEINLPTLDDALHPRLAAELGKLKAAQVTAADTNTVWLKAGRPATGKHADAANQADHELAEQLTRTRDFASATAGAARQHAVEGYRMAAARYERARQDMLAALEAAAVHANLFAVAGTNPADIGIHKGSRDPLYGHVTALAAQVDTLSLRPIAD
ncbi:hypothetical protein [Streptomyces sp. CB03911]|uniref:hypothetical protein n=1 Tax=Streptomyces sp. CB03911 TaxID=1804758 RepID=UPI0009402C22|nr:hypothetical protein [Streptomyces sp. CB03911]OKI14242.1 hypothetical protein A6A07_13915 [Streptomyces sp. CB03911]